MKYLDPEDIQRWIDAIENEQARDIALLLWKTGARISEILLLRVRDIDFQHQTINMPTLKRGRRTEREKKSEKYIRPKMRRDVLVPYPDVMDMLDKRIEGKYMKDKVFKIHRTTVWRHLQKAAEKVGIPKNLAHPHTLRHSFAVACLKAGMELPVLQKLLGHAQLSSTGMYLDVMKREEIVPLLRTIFGEMGVERGAK